MGVIPYLLKYFRHWILMLVMKLIDENFPLAKINGIYIKYIQSQQLVSKILN